MKLVFIFFTRLNYAFASGFKCSTIFLTFSEDGPIIIKRKFLLVKTNVNYHKEREKKTKQNKVLFRLT